MHVLRIGRMLLTLSVVGWLSWTSLHAQETSALAPGDSIRLRTSVSGQLTGRVQSLTADTLVLQTGRVPITVPLGEITQLERRRGGVGRHGPAQSGGHSSARSQRRSLLVFSMNRWENRVRASAPPWHWVRSRAGCLAD